jgi:hypothetical protein
VGKLVSIDAGRSRVIGLIYAAAAADQGKHAGERDVTLVKVELVGEIREDAETSKRCSTAASTPIPPWAPGPTKCCAPS